MPPVVAFVAAALVNIGIGAATAGIIAGIVVTTVTGFLVNTIGKLIAGGYNAGDQGTVINMSRDPAAPREYIYGLRRTGGTIAYVESTGTDNENVWLVNVYADHEIDSFQGVYYNDELIAFSSNAATTAPYANFAWRYEHLGAASQTVDTTLDAASSRWTSNHRLRGCAYQVHRLLYDRDVYPTGLQNISVLVKGKKVYDPRLDSTVSGGSGSHRAATESTWAWSVNPVLCALDYLRDSYLGPGFPLSAFDMANIQAAANICDETVSVTGGGTILRYSVDAIVNSSMSHEEVMDLMTRSMAGTLTFSGGVFRFHPGAYDSPAATFTESDIVSVEWKKAPSRRELANQVKGLFIDTGNAYQPADYPVVTDSTAVTEDGGEVFWLTLDLPFTTDHRMAQRIARIAKNQARQRGSGTIRVNLKGLDVRVWDTIQVTHTNFSWSSKVLRVHGWRLNSPESEGDAYTIDLDVKEEASAVYSWTAASHEAAYTAMAGGGPVVTIPLDLSAPANLTAVAATFVGSDGSKIPAIKVTWDDPSPFIISTDVQLSPDNGTTWLPYGTVPASSGDGAIITGLVKGTTYKVRVAHINSTFVVSAWSTSGSVTITDTTIAGTILNQGDLAVLDSVNTAQINPNAVTDNTGTDKGTVALTEGGTTTLWDLAVTAPAGYDVDVTFMFTIGGTGFGDRTAYQCRVQRVDVGPTDKFPLQGAPTLFNELGNQANVIPFIDPDIATANPTYRLSVTSLEAGWTGTASNLQARIFVIKR